MKPTIPEPNVAALIGGFLQIATLRRNPALQVTAEAAEKAASKERL